MAITRAYRTTSYEKLFMVTGVISFELEAIRKKMLREKSIELERRLTREEIEEVLRWENTKLV